MLLNKKQHPKSWKNLIQIENRHFYQTPNHNFNRIFHQMKGIRRNFPTHFPALRSVLTKKN